MSMVNAKKAQSGQRKRLGRNKPKKGGKPQPFRGRCHLCNKVGHKKSECPDADKKGDRGVAFMASETASSGWLLDSGASSHMTLSRGDFFKYEVLETPIDVTIADGADLKAIGRGSVRFRCGNGTTVKLLETLHIPYLHQRLLSVPKIAQRGLDVRFGANNCGIGRDDELLLSAKRHSNSARRGHPSAYVYKATESVITGLPAIKPQVTSDLCGGCLKGKMTVATFLKASNAKSTTPLQLIHSDVMGPIRTLTPGRSRYIFTFVDDYSSFVSVYFLKAKSEVTSKFLEYKNEMERQCGTRIKCVRTDNGSEYCNKQFTAICKKNGIIHQRSLPYRRQQNGDAERMNRTIVDKARSMLHLKCVAKKWWAEAVSSAVYLINRCTNKNNQSVTPFELCFKCKPQLDHVRVLGSLGYAHINESKRTKFDAKGFRCMLLAYASNAKSYKVLDLDTNAVKTSRSIIVDEREVGGNYEDAVVDVMTDPTGALAANDEDDLVINAKAKKSDSSPTTDDVEMEDASMPDTEMEDTPDSGVDLIVPRHDGDIIAGEPQNVMTGSDDNTTSSRAIVFRQPLARQRRHDNPLRVPRDDTSHDDHVALPRPPIERPALRHTERPALLLQIERLEPRQTRGLDRPQIGGLKLPMIERPETLMLESGDNENQLVVYDNSASGCTGNERRNKRPRRTVTTMMTLRMPWRPRTSRRHSTKP
ncbi:TPA: hypothetical protein N0F65_008698 [Lagenidium giganteum]|uniref:Polyprotein n=1 Tax=Lagenidium giganteum TaxID=4803 RepID=A0AAV2YKX4_9STRA|nr:TPA: hypothetical protein N0F65_008698 [Lagenidium giganteum]